VAVTVEQQRASTNVPVLFLAEMHFTTGVQRFTTWSHNLPFDGHSWLAVGMVSVGAVKTGERLEYPAMDIGLQVGNPTLLALALESPSTYRWRDITLYQAFLTDDLQPLGEPELCWAGYMDQVRVNTGDGEQNKGSISLRCEMQGRDTRMARSLRLNNAQHQLRWPGDTFLSRIETLGGKPTPWLSRRFQQV
jgi:hypothetical protein